MTKTKICSLCGVEKDFDCYWQLLRNTDKKDDICIECKEKQRTERESSPAGLYELRARLLSTIFRPIWFPDLSQDLALDHKFSINKGYMRDVPLDVIANINNLEPLTPALNRRKGSKCSISIDELFRTYKPNQHLSKMAELLNRKNRDELRCYGKYVRNRNL